MDKVELCRRLKRLGQPYAKLAPRLGLSASGLYKLTNGQRHITRPTEMLLDQLEKEWVRRPAGKSDGKTGKPEPKLLRRPGIVSGGKGE